ICSALGLYLVGRRLAGPIARAGAAAVLVPALLALGVLACAFALGRFNRLHGAFLAGLALVGPHAVWPAVGGAGVCRRLSSGWTLPRLALVVAGLVLATAAGGLLWRWRRPRCWPPGRRSPGSGCTCSA